MTGSTTVDANHYWETSMSKDKSGKKDKLKKHDLFALMLDQSEAFREMVAHFQEVWGPGNSSVNVELIAGKIPEAKAVKAKKPARTVRTAASKPVTKAAATSKKTKPAVTAKSPKASKKTAGTAHSAKKAKPAITRKPAAKTVKASKKKSTPGK